MRGAVEMHAHAMIFTAPGSPLEFRELPLPVLNDGEAIVRVDCTTLCGSDLHSFHGRRKVPVPTILGHEILGTIESLNGEVKAFDGTPLHIGDRVTWGVAVSCGGCFYCHHRLPQKCDSLRKYGHEKLDALIGGLSTHCHLLAGTAIFRLPNSLSDIVACPASCATATVAAVLRAAGNVTGETVLIFGAGMLGLTAAAMARTADAVIVCDIDESRLETARRFGATHTATPDQLGSVVGEVTHGRGVGVALELSGSAMAMTAGLELLRIGGAFIWAGAVSPTPTIAIAPETIVRKLIRIEGVHNYRPDDLGVALAFLDQHASKYPFAELVPRSFELRAANDAFRYATDERPVRVAVIPKK